MPLAAAATTSFLSLRKTLISPLSPFVELPCSSNVRLSGRSPPQYKAPSRTRPRVHQVENGKTVASESKYPNWRDFANRVSGEWDGYGADFTCDGKPVELPESVVPEAFREWDVEVFDWQTQCPTLAETGRPTLTYKLIRLLPTVGCEADAATRYSTEERVIGGVNNSASAFAYDIGGSYVALWSSMEQNERRIFELEHCLVNPSDREERIRIIQVFQLEKEKATRELQKIKIFSENWYGPFRNGEQLGGCSIRETGFAATGALKQSEVTGVWQSTRVVTTFDSSQSDIICELVAGMPEKSTRHCEGLVMLPKKLWCSFGGKGSEMWAEVGWLLQKGHAMTSKCILSNGSLKAAVIAQEVVVLDPDVI